MPSQTLYKIKAGEVFKRALKPPLQDQKFWVVQSTVLIITVIHYWLDYQKILTQPALSSIPVFILLLPVSYAATEYGLHGSAATSLWSTLLWIPDIFISHNSVSLEFAAVGIVVVNAVGIITGERIEREQLAKNRVKATEEQLKISEARFRHLFATTRAPILLFDEDGKVVNANPAAWGVFKNNVLDLTFSDICKMSISKVFKGENPISVELEVDGKSTEFRCLISSVKEGDAYVTQLLLQDITEERRAFRDVKAFASSLLNAQEDERLRISRELHDDPLQAIIHSSRQIDSILMDDTGIADQENRTTLDKVKSELLRVARSIRSIAQGLRPPSLEHLGLSATVNGLIADLEQDYSGTINLDIKGTQRRLKLDTELALYRICQESLQNAIVHSGADNVLVKLTFTNSTVSLVVSDNGNGFEVNKPIDAKHLGIKGIRERVSLLGGTFSIMSTQKDGTTVSVLIPITAGFVE